MHRKISFQGAKTPQAGDYISHYLQIKVVCAWIIVNFRNLIKNDTTLAKVTDAKCQQLAKQSNVNGRFEAMDMKVSGIDGKLSEASNDITMLKSKLNEFGQAKLTARMEISGIDKTEIAANKLDPASLAVKVISSFNIEINRNAIHFAYFREWKQKNVSILVVEFTSVEIKAEIMKKKRAMKETNNDFFDHAMTPATRALFVKA